MAEVLKDCSIDTLNKDLTKHHEIKDFYVSENLDTRFARIKMIFTIPAVLQQVLIFYVWCDTMLLVILKGIFIMSKMELTVQDCMKIIGTETKDNKLLILVLGILMTFILFLYSVFLALIIAIIVAVLYWNQAKKSKKCDNKKFLIKIDTCVKKKKVETPDSDDYYIYFMDNGEVKMKNVFWRTADNGYKCLYDSIEKTDKCFLLCLESDVNVYAIFPTKDFELKLDEFVEKSGIYYPTI